MWVRGTGVQALRALGLLALILCASLAPVAAASSRAATLAATADEGRGGLDAHAAAREAPSPPRWREYSLRALAPEVDEWLAGRAGQVGVAVVVPGARRVYVSDTTPSLGLASVAKVPIMLTLLSQLGPAKPELSAEEWQWLEAMITVSNNEAADALWPLIGGAEGMNNFLRRAHVRGVNPDPDGYWGESTATAGSLALLLGKLIDGELLDEPQQAVALELLTRVEAYDQQWGVRAGLPDDLPPETRVGLKDGWYEWDDGWWVNSIGFVMPADGRPAYSVAVLTNQQPSFEYGLMTIEVAARLIHARLDQPVGVLDIEPPPLYPDELDSLTLP